MIRIENLHARYPTAPEAILRGASLAIPPRRTLALLGGSGCGKSTLLKCLLRLIEPETGRIFIDDEDIAGLDPVQLRRRIGMVFQGIALFPAMNIHQNVALALTLAGWPKADIRPRVREMLDLVGLEPGLYGPRYPDMLSGGQQQRVGVARALAARPSYLLMDEPFGALDAITRRNLQEELKRLRRSLDITILFVTHDVLEAASIGDEIAVMGAGTVLQIGTLDALMHRPAHPTVRHLVTEPLAAMRRFLADGLHMDGTHGDGARTDGTTA